MSVIIMLINKSCLQISGCSPYLLSDDDWGANEKILFVLKQIT